MEYILELLFGNIDPNIQLGIAPMAAAAIVQSVGGMVSGLFGAARARRQRRAAAREKRKLTGELNSLEKSRQKIINPYDNFKNLSSLAKDLSGKLSNPYANLGVATQGAEIQMEQTDLALANTLDTLRATGASAGGATALAQAALQSKQGVAASIEQQEAANEKLRAQGQQQLEQLQMNEGIRVQQTQIGEGQRMQQADAAGRQFMFNAQERRQDDKINYTRGQLADSKQREQQAYNQQTQAMQSVIGGISGIGAVGAAGGFKKNPTADEITAISKLIK